MNIIKKRLLLAILAIFVLFGTTSCTFPFYMKASGSLDHSILFRFFEEENDEKPSKFDINMFIVKEQTADAQWISIWVLIGGQTLSSIEYGIKYKELTEIVPHKPLAKGKQYRAYAGGSTVWPKPAGAGGAVTDFFFDEGGNLIQGSIK